MKFTAAVAVVLISASMALAQKAKDPVPPVRLAPPAAPHKTVIPAVTNSPAASSAAELTRIEQQSARLRLNKPVTHHTSGSTVATPALDQGKNKHVPATHSPQPTNPPH